MYGVLQELGVLVQGLKRMARIFPVAGVCPLSGP